MPTSHHHHNQANKEKGRHESKRIYRPTSNSARPEYLPSMAGASPLLSEENNKTTNVSFIIGDNDPELKKLQSGLNVELYVVNLETVKESNI